jgi:hypothetical protein
MVILLYDRSIRTQAAQKPTDPDPQHCLNMQHFLTLLVCRDEQVRSCVAVHGAEVRHADGQDVGLRGAGADLPRPQPGHPTAAAQLRHAQEPSTLPHGHRCVHFIFFYNTRWVPLLISSLLPLGRRPPLGCRAEIRTRACHTTSRRATFWATPHPFSGLTGCRPPPLYAREGR